jgi:hypothetical protein
MEMRFVVGLYEMRRTRRKVGRADFSTDMAGKRP